MKSFKQFLLESMRKDVKDPNYKIPGLEQLGTEAQFLATYGDNNFLEFMASFPNLIEKTLTDLFKGKVSVTPLGEGNTLTYQIEIPDTNIPGDTETLTLDMPFEQGDPLAASINDFNSIIELDNKITGIELTEQITNEEWFPKADTGVMDITSPPDDENWEMRHTEETYEWIKTMKDVGHDMIWNYIDEDDGSVGNPFELLVIIREAFDFRNEENQNHYEQEGGFDFPPEDDADWWKK